MRQVCRELICCRHRWTVLCGVAVTLLAACLFFGQINYWDNVVPWVSMPLPGRETLSKVFRLGRDRNVYMYSAIATSYPEPGVAQSGDVEVMVTTLDGSGGGDMNCCVLFGGSDSKRILITPATIYFRKFINPPRRTLKGEKLYMARQYTCTISFKHFSSSSSSSSSSSAYISSSSAPSSSSSSQPTYLTLAGSDHCSTDFKDYLPILYPPRVPGGLALCAKIAHSGGLDPERVIEWFEVQRILGVDKVLLFDSGNQESITRVFEYYRKLGILDLQPYELPGQPVDRQLTERFKRTSQFNQDESMVVLECRHRMGGYEYVLSHDLDEMVIPRRNESLKALFKRSLARHPMAAGFHFYTEFFIYGWGPSDKGQDLMVTRYRRATLPHWECNKYMYLPRRVVTSLTHQIFTKSGYSQPRLPMEDAILHHYRECPDVWRTCNPATLQDDVMTRYTIDLEQRVRKVRQETNVQPGWTPKT